ncbi:hypothetical protein AB6A23_05255 [Paenibacillus tarimensis]
MAINRPIECLLPPAPVHIRLLSFGDSLRLNLRRLKQQLNNTMNKLSISILKKQVRFLSGLILAYAPVMAQGGEGGAMNTIRGRDNEHLLAGPLLEVADLIATSAALTGSYAQYRPKLIGEN